MRLWLHSERRENQSSKGDKILRLVQFLGTVYTCSGVQSTST
jgi:hypothetical protein